MEENKNTQSNEPQAPQNGAEQVVEPTAPATTEGATEATNEGTNEATTENTNEVATNKVAEVAVETVAPVADAAPVAPAAPAAKTKGKKSKSGKTSFGKIFLAALLAVMAGSVLSMLFRGILYSGFSSMMQPTQTTIPESAILRIDLSENLVEAPSKGPMAMFNFASMTTNGELTLYNALRAIEKASTDERIKGI